MLLLTCAKFHHHNLSHSLSHPPPHFCAISGSFKISMNKNRIAGFLLPSQIAYTNYKGVDPTRYTPQYVVCLQSGKKPWNIHAITSCLSVDSRNSL